MESFRERQATVSNEERANLFWTDRGQAQALKRRLRRTTDLTVARRASQPRGPPSLLPPALPSPGKADEATQADEASLRFEGRRARNSPNRMHASVPPDQAMFAYSNSRSAMLQAKRLNANASSMAKSSRRPVRPHARCGWSVMRDRCTPPTCPAGRSPARSGPSDGARTTVHSWVRPRYPSYNPTSICDRQAVDSKCRTLSDLASVGQLAVPIVEDENITGAMRSVTDSGERWYHCGVVGAAASSPDVNGLNHREQRGHPSTTIVHSPRHNRLGPC